MRAFRAVDPRPSLRNLGFAAVVLAFFAALAHGQCGPRWVSSTEHALVGVALEPHCAFSFDPDGPGPTPQLLLVGGVFSRAGNVTARNLASFDGSVWSEFGGGCDGLVYAMSTFNGQLVIGGSFFTSGGVTTQGLAKWDQASAHWAAFPSGMAVTPQAITTHNGRLIVAGSNGSTGSVKRLSANGTSWEQLGLPFSAPVVSLAVYNGELYAGGTFTTNGPAYVPVMGLARWDGTAWRQVGTNRTGYALTLAVYQNELYAGGNVMSISGTPVRVARWDGSAWRDTGGAFDGAVNSLIVNGSELHAFGAFTSTPSGPASHAARWDGASWSALGAGIENPPSNQLYNAAVHQGSTVVVGTFAAAGELGCHKVAAWNGSSWQTFGNGVGGWTVYGTTHWHDKLVMVGDFSSVDGVPAAGVALWDGTLGGMTGLSRSLRAPGGGRPVAFGATEFRGNLVVIGDLSDGSGGPWRYVAQWDGTSWSHVGGGVNAPGEMLGVYNGDLIVGGGFTAVGPNDSVAANRIARWDGAAWHPLGQGLGGAPVCCTVFNGDLIVGGVFPTAGGQQASLVARWDGSQWWPMPGLQSGSSVDALYVFNNELWAAGSFAGAVARWNGSTWQTVPPVVGYRAYALQEYAGRLVVGGSFTMVGSQAFNGFASWDGATWQPLGTGLSDPIGESVRTLAVFNGELVAGGAFSRVGGLNTAAVARWTASPGPAVAVHPADVIGVCGVQANAAFYVVCSPGYGTLTYQWTLDGTPVADGPSPDGSVVSGAATPVLTVTGAGGSGGYACVVSGACGSTTTRTALLELLGADTGAAGGLPGADGELNNNDFIVFINWFFAGDAHADRGAAGGVYGRDGALDNNDFIAFIGQFFNALTCP